MMRGERSKREVHEGAVCARYASEVYARARLRLRVNVVGNATVSVTHQVTYNVVFSDRCQLDDSFRVALVGLVAVHRQVHRLLRVHLCMRLGDRLRARF